jgi:hypothetical protein
MRNLIPGTRRISCTHSATRPAIEPRGFVHVAGKFAEAHRPEIYVVMYNEMRRALRPSTSLTVSGVRSRNTSAASCTMVSIAGTSPRTCGGGVEYAWCNVLRYLTELSITPR